MKRVSISKYEKFPFGKEAFKRLVTQVLKKDFKGELKLVNSNAHQDQSVIIENYSIDNERGSDRSGATITVLFYTREEDSEFDTGYKTGIRVGSGGEERYEEWVTDFDSIQDLPLKKIQRKLSTMIDEITSNSSFGPDLY